MTTFEHSIDTDAEARSEETITAAARTPVDARYQMVVHVTTSPQSPSTNFPAIRLLGGEQERLAPWRRFGEALHVRIEHASVHQWAALPTDYTGEVSSAFRKLLAESFAGHSMHYSDRIQAEASDRRNRYAELSRLLDEWANEPGDFDAEVDPMIEEALRESAPRHFPEE